MPYILYPLGAAAQDNCHCQLSSSEDIGARTRGGRALCAYLSSEELRVKSENTFARQVRQRFFALEALICRECEKYLSH